MKAPFRFHFIRMIAVSILLFVLILLSFGCCKNPADNDEPDTVTDIDGNEYTVVKIGDQWWMAENLKVTHFRNGDAIPNVTGGTEWAALATGACCVYDNYEINSATYGYLYNWYAVIDSREIAPEGWHVANDEDWGTLVIFLGGSSASARKMKEKGTLHWIEPNDEATNKSGFTALPGGCRTDFGSFGYLSYYAYFWSTREYDINEAWFRRLDFDTSAVFRLEDNKKFGFSVRCVKGE